LQLVPRFPIPMWSWSTNVTARRTDGQTTRDHKTALCSIVHRAIKWLKPKSF